MFYLDLDDVSFPLQMHRNHSSNKYLLSKTFLLSTRVFFPVLNTQRVMQQCFIIRLCGRRGRGKLREAKCNQRGRKCVCVCVSDRGKKSDIEGVCHGQ